MLIGGTQPIDARVFQIGRLPQGFLYRRVRDSRGVGCIKWCVYEQAGGEFGFLEGRFQTVPLPLHGNRMPFGDDRYPCR